MKRTNRNNDGRSFQEMVNTTAVHYSPRLRIRKIDPPVRLIGGGAFRRVIFLENPYPDFVGAWTERGGRMIAIECKSTKEPHLNFGKSGLTEHQYRSLIHWHRAGAVAFVLWQHGDQVKVATAQEIYFEVMKAAAGDRWRHFKFEEPMWHLVPPGPGMIRCDFLPVIEKLFPEA